MCCFGCAGESTFDICFGLFVVAFAPRVTQNWSTVFASVLVICSSCGVAVGGCVGVVVDGGDLGATWRLVGVLRCVCVCVCVVGQCAA